MKNLILYHDNCADGFTAAWVAEGVLSQDQDTEIIGVQYNEPAPLDLIDSQTRVYILDFSYPWADMLAICDAAATVVLLDHHKTAMESISGLKHPKLAMVLDPDYSGAGLTWRWFFPDKRMPDLVARVQDRDLWRFTFDDSKAVAEAIFAREFDLAEWDAMAKMSIKDLAKEGEVLQAKKDKDIAGFIIQNSHYILVGDFLVPACNLPAQYANETGNKLLQFFPNAPFSAIYWQAEETKMRVSLRSENSREDVSRIAKKFGGGGHRNAAGFKIDNPAISFPLPPDPIMTFEDDEED